MKKILQLLLIFVPAFSFAQTFEHDTLTTTTGFKIYEDQMLKMGVGSTPDGDFKYIRISATSLFQYSSNNGYNGLANQANNLSRRSSNLSYKVVRIDKRGSKKNGYVFYPIINVGAVRYEVDVENAIASGELVVPEEFMPKKPATATTVVQPLSVADELAKLKKLYDDGVLTKEEFEAQKKKLLEKN